MSQRVYMETDENYNTLNFGENWKKEEDSQIYTLQVNLCQKSSFCKKWGRKCCLQKLFLMSETISVQNIPRFELGIFMY